MLIIKRN